jgi:hypothetical protein
MVVACSCEKLSGRLFGEMPVSEQIAAEVMCAGVKVSSTIGVHGDRSHTTAGRRHS